MSSEAADIQEILQRAYRLLNVGEGILLRRGVVVKRVKSKQVLIRSFYFRIFNRRGIGGLAGSRFGAGGKRAGSMQPSSGVDDSVQDESSLDGEDTMSSEK